MHSPQALPPPIAHALRNGSTILTANQRAARSLRRAYDLHSHALGLPSWQPPPIFAWDTWLDSLWQRLLAQGNATGLLLNRAQEHALWRSIIDRDAATSSVQPIHALAELASAAWSLLHACRGRDRLHAFPGNSDTGAFARWVRAFESLCAGSDCLTRAQLPAALIGHIAARRLHLPASLLLTGFDSTTLAQSALLDALRAAGISVEHLPQTSPALDLVLASSPDRPSELAACAIWLRSRLTAAPGSTIAVIVPSIEPVRDEIDRTFRAILAPELNHIASTSGSGPYEFSLGIPLAQTPLAAAALDILHWAIAPLPLTRIGSLLLSPHFASADPPGSELLARAEFDAFTLRRRRLLHPALAIDGLFQLVSSQPHNRHLPALLHHLRRLRAVQRRHGLTAPRAYADWAGFIHDLLDAAGWALPSHLDSTEFQARRKWDAALDELATLDFAGARPAFAEALAALERIAADALFAPQSRHAPIQIMGPLESSGSSFDAVWFLRAGDLDWPSPPAANPLLPWLLQRALAMPGADPAADAAHSLRITRRIASSAPAVIFSYAQQDADGRRRPSSLVAGLGCTPRAASTLAPAPPIAAPIALDSSLDLDAIPHPPAAVLRGGASILQAQAACGFRAFAEWRLFASAPDSVALGLDPRERGSLVHRVLEFFWAAVESQSKLRQMTPSERDAQLSASIDAALNQDYGSPAPGWPAAFAAAERRRLLNLLIPWLEYEAARPPFTVLAREQLSGVHIGPLLLDLRVDRVDLALNAGRPAGEIILDYKTGEAKPAQWLGPRPDAPQLPLYAVASSSNLAAVAFANIRPGEDMGINGFEARNGILPRSAPLNAAGLNAQLDQWRETLASLAEAFYAGDAAVSPKRYPRTCDLCRQRLLCRLDPATLDPESFDYPDPAPDPTTDPAPDPSQSAAPEADRG